MNAVATSTIRALAMDEVSLCVPLGHAFHAEKLPWPFNPQSFVPYWAKLYDMKSGNIFGWWKDGQLVGAIGGLRFIEPNTGMILAQEAFWFVGKSFRGGIGAVRLWQRMEQWAYAEGAQEVFMIHLDDEQAECIGRMYLRRGYMKLETTYRKVL